MQLFEYDATDLTPEVWRSGGDARAFNPTIAEVEGGYVIAYRVVQVDSEHRRIATARLDHDLAIGPWKTNPGGRFPISIRTGPSKPSFRVTVNESSRPPPVPTFGSRPPTATAKEGFGRRMPSR